MRFLLIVASVLAGCSGDSASRTEPNAHPPQEPANQVEIAPEIKTVQLPGVLVNMTDRYVETEGRICLRNGLLELIATLPAGKEHESIVSLQTVPSNLHAGLLMLGLEPGEPGQWNYYEDRIETIDPTGDRVRVTLLMQKGADWQEKPIHHFVVDRERQKNLPASEFVFAGSRVVESEEEGGEPIYLADRTGDVIALVSFGTEVLAWPKAASEANESLIWLADPDALPELGAKVKLRIYPVHE